MLLLLLAAPVTMARAAGDPGWPREIKAPEAVIVMYQPQPDERTDNILTARAAVSVTGKGKTTPVFGSVWLRARMDVDREKRLVTFADVTVPRARFPGAKPEDEQKLAKVLEAEIPKWNLQVSLDRLVASLQAVEQEKAAAEAFNATPPKIIITKVPTLLVFIDGEPVLRDVEGSDLKRVVNTPYFLVQDGKKYYLNGGATWFVTDDLKGKWSTTKSPSKAVEEFYAKSRGQGQTQGGTPPKGSPQGSSKSTGAQPATSGKTTSGKTAPPEIVVATEPTELVVLDGEKKLGTITGTNLFYVTNTDGDIFLVSDSQDYYILLSGRWFKSKSLDGPWTFVKPDALPKDFAKIPEPSPKGDVLASVAGTVQAEEAMVDAQVPQTAVVKRKEAKTNVVYDGEPQFKKIENTEVQYAVNTASQVLLIKGKYYVCDQAVWFIGDSPKGPWTVTDKIPPEVKQIPPDSPVYNTKYVYVYDSTPEVVYVGYTPGYVGCYPYYGTVVYGTGWYYPPYVSPYAYYPYQATFGFNVHYNPYTGWSLGIGFSYGPFSFTFWGGGYGGYYGPAYGGGYYHGGNTINIGEINVGNGNRPDGGRGQGGRGNSASTLPTNSNIYNRGENKGRNASTTDKQPRPAPKQAANGKNNVYSDRDGNVYKRGNDGSWQTRDGGSWKSNQGVGTSGNAPGTSDRVGSGGRGSQGVSSMERDYQARQRGSERAQGYSRGGYGGMGGSRGGGRRR